MRSYPAKLLLFGEHTVLIGSSSLAIPLPEYSMSWVNKEDDHPIWLVEYANYIKEQCTDIIDIPKLTDWLDIYTIETNIPIGYGLGSSGALTAAIYDICGSETDHDDFLRHQRLMARMESFFHGKSSGFDPLVSYANAPVLRKENAIEVAAGSLSFGLEVALVDSGRPRAGRELIQKFMSAYESAPQHFAFLVELNTELSEGLFQGETENIYHKIREISVQQIELMEFLITPNIKSLWEGGLRSSKYTMKICGAGGGGYFLCIKNPGGAWPDVEDLTELQF